MYFEKYNADNLNSSINMTIIQLFVQDQKQLIYTHKQLKIKSMHTFIHNGTRTHI